MSVTRPPRPAISAAKAMRVRSSASSLARFSGLPGVTSHHTALSPSAFFATSLT